MIHRGQDMSWQGNPEPHGLRSIAATGEFVRQPGAGPDTRVGWSDEALMVAVAARDDLAFSALYDRYSDMVFATSLRVLADRQLAEDATQDVFVRLWRRPELFMSERGRFLSWLMSVTRNRAVDELRARGRRRRREATTLLTSEDPGENIQASDVDDPLSTAQLHEEQALVRKALAVLPFEQRRALELAYFGGMTQQEIALALHEPLGTVKTRIRLGMQKLRTALAESVRG
jgi:RNA polymerase sigma-70 factor (ECF subfamily)